MTKLKDIDEFFMKKALRRAEIAFKENEVPVGAIVVDSCGKILGVGYNKVEKKKCQTAHAEIIAIKKACKKKRDWRLDYCSLYVTLEPCLMCWGLIALSRFKRVIFGTKSTLFGLKQDFDKLPVFYSKGIEVNGGILEKECLDILKCFFKIAREKGKGLR